MVLRASEFYEPVVRQLQTELVNSLIDPLGDAYLKAEGMLQNFLTYCEGGREDFHAYFVRNGNTPEDIERQFWRILKLEADPSLSQELSPILKIGKITLYAWSNMHDGQASDAYYEACQNDELPIYFQQATRSDDQTETT